MVNLNLVKPISNYTKMIAKKCGWANVDAFPLRKILRPEKSCETVKFGDEVLTIGTKLNPNNFVVMEIMSNNDRVAKSPFVHANLTEILNMSKTSEGAKMVKDILTEETIGKLDLMREMVKRHPREYIKDKSQIKYIPSPAGLRAFFSDISMLKAAAILNKKDLQMLFKSDITCGKGKNVLDKIGKMGAEEIATAQKSMQEGQSLKILSELQ